MSAPTPAAECEHDWCHLREVSYTKMRGTWGDEFFCRRCLAKRKVGR